MSTTHTKTNIVTSPFTTILEDNIATLKSLFHNCGDYTDRKFTLGEKNHISVYIAYTDNMVDRDLLESNIIRNLIYRMDEVPGSDAYTYIKERALQTADMKEVHTMDEITQAVMTGDVAVLVDGFRKALIVSFKDFPGRGVSSVESEVTLKGAKDSFTESIALNKVLIRRRIKDTKLKLENLQTGVRTRTDISLVYIEDIAEQGLIDEVKKRLDRYLVDGIFDVGMLEQMLEDSWYSPFPQFQSTERPDKTAASLLEGRVAILVDNSPMALLLPATMNMFFQASDDYYSRWQIVSFIRILRYIGALIAVMLPGLYIAITNYQPELIPTPLVLSFSAARQGVPFSILLEVIIMQIAFELLTEAGIRLPSPMGNTIGVVGGLIIGDAAISANLVSPMAVIVVALTAIASFTVPNETFTSAFRITRYLVILLSAMLGLYGCIVGFMLLLIHLAGLKSFGIPYLSPFVAINPDVNQPLADSIVKYPFFRLKKRPLFSNREEKIRLIRKEKSN